MDTTEIKSLLKDYHYHKMQIRNGISHPATEKKLIFIENCIDSLDAENKLIIKAVFFENISVGEMAKKLGYARRSIYYRIDKWLARIACSFLER